MDHFVGIDLHPRNSYIAIIDNDNRRFFKKRISNNRQKVLLVRKPNREHKKGTFGVIPLSLFTAINME